jgi:hypothetical protein
VDADPARDGTVWIAEDVDREDTLLLTGRFSGYLEQDERPKDTFEDVEAQDAIAWGRSRAATVLIRTGDSGRYFSAGEHNPDPQRFPDWSPAGVRLERRRPRGFEALDNAESDPPVLWDVRIEAELGEPVDAGPFHERIRTTRPRRTRKPLRWATPPSLPRFSLKRPPASRQTRWPVAFSRKLWPRAWRRFRRGTSATGRLAPRSILTDPASP